MRLGLGAAALSFAGRILPARALAPAAGRAGLVDVHHHFIPPFWLSENRERIAASFGGKLGPAWFEWRSERALEAMDRSGVQTGILSVTSPGVWFGDAEEGRRIARRVNDFGAELVRSHPGRFGQFAAIPLPDAEGSLREIAYACDQLKADGIGLLTSYGDRWLGHAAFAPVLEELDRRRAVVFVHPTVAPCCRTLLPDVMPVITEIPQDTARAIANLLYTGTLARFRNIRFVFAHAGGNLATVYSRMVRFPPRELGAPAPAGIDAELRRLHYDIAAAFRPNVAALTSIVPVSQLLLGTDHPYASMEDTVQGMPRIGLAESEVRAVGRENALALFPRLKVA